MPFPGPSGNQGAVLGNAQCAWWRGVPGPGGCGRPLVSHGVHSRVCPHSLQWPLLVVRAGRYLLAFQPGTRFSMGACQWHQMCALPVSKSHHAEGRDCESSYPLPLLSLAHTRAHSHTLMHSDISQAPAPSSRSTQGSAEAASPLLSCSHPWGSSGLTVPLCSFLLQYEYSFRTEQSAAARLPPSPTRCQQIPQS